MHRQKISAKMLRRVKQYHRRQYTSIHICMYTHIYMHIHICAQPAANVSQMCMSMSKEHLYNAYSCTCTGAQNTCSKLHTTPTTKKCTYIYTSTHMHTHAYAQEYTWASMTLLEHAKEWLLRLKIYAQTCIHIVIYMHVYTHTYTQADIYIYACSYTHIHTHIYAHIYNMYICTHASAAATARGANADAGSSVCLFRSMLVLVTVKTDACKGRFWNGCTQGSFWAPMRATRKAILTAARNGLLSNGCAQGMWQIPDARNLHPGCGQPL
jgi:hypothetical protein